MPDILLYVQALCGMIVRKLASSGVVLSSRKDQRIKFVVRHTIADIEYSCDGFVEKNQDFLKRELLDILKASQNKVMAELFENVQVEAGKIGKGLLIASQFLRSLSSMIETIKVRSIGRSDFRSRICSRKCLFV